MKLATGIGGWPGAAPAAARAAEDAGYDTVTCGELSHDSILTMALASTSTERIELQTGVTIAFPRSPMVLAMEAWDIQQASGGRFSIGLGSQVKGHNERRFGGTWAPPAPRMKEYIQMMKAIWATWQDDAPAEFLGKHYRYTLMTPNFNPGPLDFPKPKVFLAVVGDGMARVAGEVADGLLPHGGIMTDRYMREVMLPNVKQGLERSGRTWDDIEVAASGYLVIGDTDEEIEKGLDAMRTPLSFYGSTRTYHKVLKMHDLEGLGMKLHELSLRGGWKEMRETITNDDLLKLTQTTSWEGYPAFLAEHREYASRSGFSLPKPDHPDYGRRREIMQAVQALETPGIARGLEM